MGNKKSIRMKIFVLILAVNFSIALNAQSQNNLLEKARKEREYKIQEIDSTARYYIVNSYVKKKPVLLVIDKNSEQLRNKQLEKCHTYRFSTYKFYDAVAPSGILCHEVDHKEIWCEGDEEALHFTDGMGNAYSE